MPPAAGAPALPQLGLSPPSVPSLPVSPVSHAAAAASSLLLGAGRAPFSALSRMLCHLRATVPVALALPLFPGGPARAPGPRARRRSLPSLLCVPKFFLSCVPACFLSTSPWATAARRGPALLSVSLICFVAAVVCRTGTLLHAAACKLSSCCGPFGRFRSQGFLSQVLQRINTKTQGWLSYKWSSLKTLRQICFSIQFDSQKRAACVLHSVLFAGPSHLQKCLDLRPVRGADRML